MERDKSVNREKAIALSQQHPPKRDGMHKHQENFSKSSLEKVPSDKVPAAAHAFYSLFTLVFLTRLLSPIVAVHTHLVPCDPYGCFEDVLSCKSAATFKFQIDHASR